MISNSPNSAESLSNLGRRGSLYRNTKSLEGPPSSPVKCGTGGGGSSPTQSTSLSVSYLAPPDSFTICLVPDTLEFTTKYKNDSELTERILRDLTFSKYHMIIK